MKIRLNTFVENAPRGSIEIVAEDGRTKLIETDYDLPGVAGTFGWNIETTRPAAPDFYSPGWRDRLEVEELTDKEQKAFALYEVQLMCLHRETDGTVTCPTCGMTATDFITAARAWIDDEYDGRSVDDPGHFDG